MRNLTLALSYYDQPQILARQIETWLNYPPDVRERMTFFVVDDGSPLFPPAIPANQLAGCDLRLYRIDRDVRWGWPQARNLAMHEAPDGWVLMTDIDHVLPADQAEVALSVPLREGCAYLPARRKPDGSPWKRHQDSFLLERSTFWRTGGYDLRFVGWYGTSSIFRNRLAMMTPLVETDAFHQVVYNLGGENLADIPDAGVSGMGRKGSEHHVSRCPELAPLKKTAHLTAPEGDPLAFPWHRVV